MVKEGNLIILIFSFYTLMNSFHNFHITIDLCCFLFTILFAYGVTNLKENKLRPDILVPSNKKLTEVKCCSFSQKPPDFFTELPQLVIYTQSNVLVKWEKLESKLLLQI